MRVSCIEQGTLLSALCSFLNGKGTNKQKRRYLVTCLAASFCVQQKRTQHGKAAVLLLLLPLLSRFSRVQLCATP